MGGRSWVRPPLGVNTLLLKIKCLFIAIMYGFKFNKASLLWILTWFVLAIAISFAVVSFPMMIKGAVEIFGRPVLAETIVVFMSSFIIPLCWLMWYVSKPKCVSGNSFVDFLYFIFGGPFYIAARLTDKDCKKSK